MELPSDILIEISHLIPLNKYKIRVSWLLTNKELYHYYLKQIHAIISIQKFYKLYRINNNYLTNAGLSKYKKFCYINWNDWDDHLVRRFYIAKYPLEYLYQIPEWIIDSAFMTYDQQRIEELQIWVNNNLSSEPNTRNIKDIKRFLYENSITSKELIKYVN
jgi:hypothetical protein